MTFAKVESWKKIKGQANPSHKEQECSSRNTYTEYPKTATVWKTCLANVFMNEVDYGCSNFKEKELNRGGTEFPLFEFPGQVSVLATGSSGARIYAHQPLPKASSHCTASC